eukprot:GFUD01009765.1.p1 GENE.GFUD01009765.1~~GFUD01009765.1.p1  ORF type:complete len:200 (+),score=18.06 GFUD01009765.1:72-671(+)
MASKTYIFRDMVSGCEMFNIAHPHKLMAGNDAVICVQSMMINENGSTIDVGGGNHFGGEDTDAAQLDDGEVVVNNIIATAGLVEVEFKKKALVEWAKPYLASVKGRLEKERPERVQPFMQGAQAFVQTLIKEHSEYVIYVNAELDYEGALAFARFDDGATVPKFYFFRDGLGLFFPGQGTSLDVGRVPQKVAVEQGCIL